MRMHERIAARQHDLIVVNLANPDMIGDAGGTLLIRADHGNCEQINDPTTGGPHAAHTVNPTPLLQGGPAGVTAIADGSLAETAPPILALLALPQPAEMAGQSLLRFSSA